MVIATSNNELKKEVGLVPLHSYSVLEAFQIEDGKQLIRLRNPWGYFEWKGEYSDEKDFWSDENLKKYNY